MNKSKIIVVTVLLMCTCVIFLLPASSHETLAGMRWCHMSTINGIPRCDILINWDHIDITDWRDYVQDAINNWNYYSGGRVNIDHAAYRSSNVDLYDFGTTDYSVAWPYDDCYAFTTIRDKYSREYNGGIFGCDESEFSMQWNGVRDYRIDFAYIIFNPNYDDGGEGEDEDTQETNLIKTITHEIGHCLNLGHAPSSVQSVMQQGWGLDWDNYDRPQAHDRTDLRNYYNSVYK